MARPKRGWNSHELKLRAFPFFARLRGEEPLRAADEAEWRAEADEMQRWIAASGIERRPSRPRYEGPILTVAGGVKPS